VIVYLDPSVLVCSYLPDEDGHKRSRSSSIPMSLS